MNDQRGSVEDFVRQSHRARNSEPREAQLPVESLQTIDAPRRAAPESEAFVRKLRDAGGWLPGLPRPIVAAFGQRHVILDGNHRFRAAAAAGAQQIPVVVIDGFTYRQAARHFGTDRYTYIEQVLASLYPVVARNIAPSNKGARRKKGKKGTVAARPGVQFERLRAELQQPRERRLADEPQRLRGPYWGPEQLPVLVNPQPLRYGVSADPRVRTQDGREFPSLRHWLHAQMEVLPLVARVRGLLLALEMVLPRWHDWLLEVRARDTELPGDLGRRLRQATLNRNLGDGLRISDYLVAQAEMVRGALDDMVMGVQQRQATQISGSPAQLGLHWLQRFFDAVRGEQGIVAFRLGDRNHGSPAFAGFKAAYLLTLAAENLDLLVYATPSSTQRVGIADTPALAVTGVLDCAFADLLLGARLEPGQPQVAPYLPQPRMVIPALSDAWYALYQDNAEAVRPFLQRWWQRFQAINAVSSLRVAQAPSGDARYDELVEHWGNIDNFPDIVEVERGVYGGDPASEFDDPHYMEWDVWSSTEPWSEFVWNEAGGDIVRYGGEENTFNLLDDGRYLMDPFDRHVNGQAKFVYDLSDPTDAARAVRLYGVPDDWTTVGHERYTQSADAIALDDFPEAFAAAVRQLRPGSVGSAQLSRTAHALSRELGEQQAPRLTADQADFFNRYFPLYTPVFFDPNGQIIPPDRLAPSIQAFRNVYVVAGKPYAEAIGRMIFERVKSVHPDIVSNYGVYPVEVSEGTRFALDERGLGWQQYLDGYEFPVDENRNPTLLKDGFIAPAIVQGVAEFVGPSNDFSHDVTTAYSTMDPYEARRRIDELSRRYAAGTVAGAIRYLAPLLVATRRGMTPRDMTQALYNVLNEGGTEQWVAYRMLPPLRLLGGFTVYPDKDGAVPPWLSYLPSVSDYLAVTSGTANRDARRRLLRSRLLPQVPRLATQLPQSQAFPGLPSPQAHQALPQPRAHRTTQGRTVGAVMSHELDDLARDATQRLLDLHKLFQHSLEGRLPQSRQNRMFLAEMLRPVFIAAFNDRPSFAPPTIYDEPDGYSEAVRIWLTELGQAVGGYRGDWTDFVAAKYMHDQVLRAPSVEALLDGSYPAKHMSIIGAIHPARFQEWFAAGSTTVPELAVDAANYVADLEGFTGSLYHAFDTLVDAQGNAVGPQQVTGEMFRSYVMGKLDEVERRLRNLDDVNHPVNTWSLIGDSIQRKFAAVKQKRGLRDFAFASAIQEALARPSARERGMVWRSGMTPLEVAQAIWLYEATLYGEFADGDNLLREAGFEEHE